MDQAYSKLYPAILSTSQRKRVGERFKQIIAAHLGTRTRSMRALDVGCTGGTVTKTIAGLFASIVGIDPDRQAINFARIHSRTSRITYRVADALSLPYQDNSFDFILCNQVYEFVESDTALMAEIWRVLKPGGWCLFGAANKLTLIEAQYKIPLLHWLPISLSRWLVRASGKGIGYSGRYRTYWGLRSLVGRFEVHDYTPTILKDPGKFGFSALARYRALTRALPPFAWLLIVPFIPNYLWLLQKPNSD